MQMELTIRIPIRVVTESNTFGHWRGKWVRGKQQRGIVAAVLRGQSLPPLPATVQCVRYGPNKRKMDRDNLWSAFKHIFDGLADAYGVDDGDPRWEWLTPQQVRDKEYAIVITIKTKE